jgi:hypothetical protein
MSFIYDGWGGQMVLENSTKNGKSWGFSILGQRTTENGARNGHRWPWLLNKFIGNPSKYLEIGRGININTVTHWYLK